MIMGEPHCLVTLYRNRGNNYYYFEPISVSDVVIYKYWRDCGPSFSESRLNISTIFDGNNIITYKLYGDFPRVWDEIFRRLSPEVRQAFHLENS